MYSYILTQEVENDLERIHDYGVAKFGMQQADRYYEMLFDCFHKIASNPYMFPISEHLKKGYRYCVCESDTIYYKIASNHLVEIVAIIGRQDF